MADREDLRESPGLGFLAGLRRYVERAVVRFHTPGHRGGRWVHPGWARSVGRDALALDMSDVLEGPRGPGDWAGELRRAEERAARLFGAQASRFLVNGTSGGIHAAVFALAAGGEVLLSRASHISVYAAATLARATPRDAAPVYDAEWDIPGPPGAAALAESLPLRRPGLVFVTYPDYYGLAVDGRELVERARGLLVLADEAHGAHFRFCPGAPEPALEWGAAVSVQSTHKMLAALTQASMLHVGERGKELLGRIDRALSLFQTTSPSPLLLASLEAAAEQAAEEGRRSWARAVELAEWARARIERATPFRCLSPQDARERWNARLDPARLVVNVAVAGWTGLEAARILRHDWRVQVEMGNQRAVVLLFTPGNTAEDVERLVQALEDLGRRRSRSRAPAALPPPGAPPRRMLPWEAVSAPTAWVPLKESVGKIAAETVCTYPPGIPVIVPGEEVTPEVVEYLEHAAARGWEMRGPAHKDAARLGVVEESGVQ